MSQLAAPPPPPPAPFRERRGLPASPPVRIAHIVSVSGAHAIAILEKNAQGLVNAKDRRAQIGAMIKVVTPISAVIGIITAISTPMPTDEDPGEDSGLIELNLSGEVGLDAVSRRLVFRRGVSMLPSLGDAVLLADRYDLTRVYAPPMLAGIKVGALFQEPAVPARLLIDDLLAKHLVVVGSTGTGKSSALACILQRLLAEHHHAHIVMLDIHNEYSGAFGELVAPINMDKFSLPFWMLDFQEMTAALTSHDAHHDAEAEILGEAVVYARRRYCDAALGRAQQLVRKQGESMPISVDTPTPFRLSDVIAYLDEQLGRLERTQFTLPYRRLKAHIETLIADQRYNFMFGSLSVQDTMSDVLGSLFRVPGAGKPITVIDLSTVPAEILDVVISVISRLAFDLAVWSKGGLPMLLVCEEAHRYAPAGGDSKFVPTRRALARIAKEGRKYGLSLALVTQRPSELDSTILSQCGTVIALRLANDRDQQVVRAAAYDGMADLLDFLPLLGDREAVILGQGVTMPVRVKFDDLNRAAVPKNMNMGFSKAWKMPGLTREGLEEIVARWRQGGRERT
jgi:DNA helicase HerA-like ATPase